MQIDLTAITLAVLSVLSSIGLGILQFRKWKAEAKKNESSAQTDLVNVALAINKQEKETLKEIIDILKKENLDKDKIIEEYRKRLEDRHNA
jgi:hypothetical protein